MSIPRSPRVNVVVTPEQHRLLMALARHQNRSAASLVREMIDAAEPHMKRAVELFELTEETTAVSQEKALEALRSVLEDLSALVGTNGQIDLEELLNAATDDAEDALPAPSGARDDEASSPRLVTRGSGPPDPCAGGGR